MSDFDHPCDPANNRFLCSPEHPNQRSRWRSHANQAIATTLATLPSDASLKDKRAALRASYPFGPRAYHPYRIWCSAVREALRHDCPLKGPCEWCGDEGCLMCGEESCLRP